MYGNKQGLWLLLGCCVCLLNAAIPGPAIKDAWQPSAESSPPHVLEQQVDFPCRFSATVDRNYWDLSVDADWREFDGLQISFRVGRPEALRAVTLYIQTSGEWRSVSLPVAAGRQEIFIPFSDFEPAGDPGMLEKLSTVRLSPWKSENATDGGMISLYHLTPLKCRLLSVDPELSGSLNEAEWQYGLRLGGWLCRQFGDMGFPVARIPDGEAAARDLSRYELILLPYNAYPSSELLSALEAYVSEGGKLLISYSASEVLAGIAGFRMLGYRATPAAGTWHAIRFIRPGWPAPVVIPQPSTRNLIQVSPEEGGEVVAVWEDVSGRRQREAAVLISESAVWFSAVLTPEDSPAKKQMLAALVDELVPTLTMAETAVRKEAAQWLNELAESAGPQPDGLLEIERQLGAHAVFEAWQTLRELRRQWLMDLSGNFPAPVFSFRGLWDGTEALLSEEEWTKRMVFWRETGLTDVFVLAPRGSGNLIRPVRAASASGIRVHAWQICWQVTDLNPVTLRRYEREGRLQISSGGKVFPWLCPSHPENAATEVRRVLDLAGTPGLSGLHLDYVRWQNGVNCVCPYCRSSFADYLRRAPAWPEATESGKDHAAFLKWRALQIDHFVKKVQNVMHDQYPHLQLSAAVWPAVSDLIEPIGQDWSRWVGHEWLDFVVPMNYTNQAGVFRSWLEEQRRVTDNKTGLIAGIGYLTDESRLEVPEVMAQLQMAGEAGAQGFAIFKQSPEFEAALAPVLKKMYGKGVGDE